MNFDGFTPGAVADADLLVEDRWILSRLATVTQETTAALAEYRYADAAKCLYDFAWHEFCSFYVEMVKARLSDASARATAQRVLAHTLDTLLRLLHPMIPFVTEEVWHLLANAAPNGESQHHPSSSGNGAGGKDLPAESIMIAPWPEADLARQDAEIEARFARFRRCCGVSATFATGRTCRSERRSISPSAATRPRLSCSGRWNLIFFPWLQPGRPVGVRT